MPAGVAMRDQTASGDAGSRDETRNPSKTARRYQRRAGLSASLPALRLRGRLAVGVALEAPLAEPVVTQPLLMQLRLLLMDLRLRPRLARLALGELGALLARVGLGAMLSRDLLTARLEPALLARAVQARDQGDGDDDEHRDDDHQRDDASSTYGKHGFPPVLLLQEGLPASARRYTPHVSMAGRPCSLPVMPSPAVLSRTMRPSRAGSPSQRAARIRSAWPWPKTSTRWAGGSVSPSRSAISASIRAPTSSTVSPPGHPSVHRSQPGRARWISAVVWPS